MRKLLPYLTAALLGCLLLAAPARAGFHGNFGGHSFGHSSYSSFNHGYGRFNFFPAVQFVPAYAYFVPPAVIPVPVPPPLAPSALIPNAAPGDLCAAPAGSYGLAPADLASGYTQYSGTLQGYGVTHLYTNALGFHVFDVRTRKFIRVPVGRVRNFAVVRGVGVGRVGVTDRGVTRVGVGAVRVNVGPRKAVTRTRTRTIRRAR